jgi:DNA-binding response OmpR family regulator
MSRILIVEDEHHIADGLRYNLEAEGHEASIAPNGQRALDMLLGEHRPADIVILDVMLPGMDGFAVAAELRAAVLRGFEAGADDYLPKPFELEILLARVRGLLRRHRWNEPREVAPPADVYTFAGRTIDFAAMEVRSGDKSYHLTVMECDLLRYLVGKAGQPVSRKAILQEVWNLQEGVDTRAIDNFIVRLRRYIEDRPASPRFLQTVRGVGYRFVPQP